MRMKRWWWWYQWLLFRSNLDCGLWLKRERMCGLTCLLGNVPHFIIWHRVDNVIRWSQIGWYKASQNIAWRMCSVNMKGGSSNSVLEFLIKNIFLANNIVFSVFWWLMKGRWGRSQFWERFTSFAMHLVIYGSRHCWLQQRALKTVMGVEWSFWNVTAVVRSNDAVVKRELHPV